MTFEETLEKNGVLVYTNRGVSMMPLLRQGKDIMVIRRTDSYRIRDAVLFRRDNGQYVLHRILGKRNGLWYIVGDNCIEGEYIRPDQLLGVLESVKRGKREIRADDFLYRGYVRLRPAHRLYLRLRRLVGKGKHLLKIILLRMVKR